MAHIVVCTQCGKKFDRDLYPYVQVSARRYKHENCEQVNKIEEDKKRLFEYITNKFQLEFVLPYIAKQINDYITNYNFTYDGIYKTLYYFYDIKRNPIDKAKGIGIVLYVAREAKAYYDNLERNKLSSEKFEDFLPQNIVIKIEVPRPKKKKRKQFSFLEE